MRLIGCEILRKELEHVFPERAEEAVWLAAGLHVDMGKLVEAVKKASSEGENHLFLYGACHPEIDAVVSASGGCRLPGKDCIAAFLGTEERKALEGRKAFIMSPGWLRHWREIFKAGMGWDETDGRQNFGFYDVVILLDFGIEPLDDMDILEFFEFTETPVEVVPVSLDYFRGVISGVINGVLGSTGH